MYYCHILGKFPAFNVYAYTAVIMNYHQYFKEGLQGDIPYGRHVHGKLERIMNDIGSS